MQASPRADESCVGQKTRELAVSRQPWRHASKYCTYNTYKHRSAGYSYSAHLRQARCLDITESTVSCVLRETAWLGSEANAYRHTRVWLWFGLYMQGKATYPVWEGVALQEVKEVVEIYIRGHTAKRCRLGKGIPAFRMPDVVLASRGMAGCVCLQAIAHLGWWSSCRCISRYCIHSGIFFFH